MIRILEAVPKLIVAATCKTLHNLSTRYWTATLGISIASHQLCSSIWPSRHHAWYEPRLITSIVRQFSRRLTVGLVVVLRRGLLPIYPVRQTDAGLGHCRCNGLKVFPQLPHFPVMYPLRHDRELPQRHHGMEAQRTSVTKAAVIACVGLCL